MAGFGKPKQNRKIKRKESSSKIEEAIRQSLVAYQQGDLRSAKSLLEKTIEARQENSFALGFLATIERALGNNERASQLFEKSIDIDQNNPDILHNYSALLQEKDPIKAVKISDKALEISPENSSYLERNGYLKWKAGDLDNALKATIKAIEFKPDLIDAHINLGAIYKDLGNLDQALDSTLKTLELKPNNPDALMNLGWIYKDLGNLDQALDSTLKSLKFKPDNPTALSNLNVFIDQLTLSKSNAQNLTEAYELLINLDNISHRKLSNIFTQAFLPAIQEAAKSDPIISADNNALSNLAADWRLKKSLTLLIPPHQAIENFLTRLRKELLILAANQQEIPKSLSALTEVLAIQCFLNEYIYVQSPEEEGLVTRLIQHSNENEDAFSEYLAIIACYIPIHQLNLNQEWLKHYPTNNQGRKTLIQIQLEEPQKEESIKASIQKNLEIANAVSLKVQDMYEENPYPRYRYADHTVKSLEKKISESIRIESTKHNLPFPEELTTDHSCPKGLIAGCGTGSQVISASRYKNALITAIDLSSKSLAYAMRKAEEYGMENISFKMIDLIDIAKLNENFDIIECSGVLHHMAEPEKGLSELNAQLKPGGYIKLGLYSEVARQDIVKARHQVKQLGLKSTADGIREFRKKVLQGEFKELTNLPSLGADFYSLSECRDLCFHVQEHRFTTESLQKLLHRQGLIFCGFLLPESIRKTYQKQYPTDTDMTSLESWGEFEKQHPSTFKGMYQFWAQKPA
ncbi:class I SAM-dependent methyltransferase [Prochlorococcus sp. MIT 1306]|uniref:class I SAM-dependent methyltransferase n=1 Tax=Prochlorococcus sp. MIT 1306 TaxID=1799667 RepID=UPI0007BBB192|nr:class I SAM-dependent methyltransferase [Prochlorococcus sp. MIT 1306]KZR66017.1 TPR repeat-containing protein YrrB [Prochlorococcus sp. MIT 1306]